MGDVTTGRSKAVGRTSLTLVVRGKDYTGWDPFLFSPSPYPTPSSPILSCTSGISLVVVTDDSGPQKGGDVG